MAKKKADAAVEPVDDVQKDIEEAEAILAASGFVEPEPPKTQLQEMVEAFSQPAPKMPDEMPPDDRVVYVWSPTLRGESSFDAPTDVAKKRSAIHMPDGAVFLSTKQGPRVRLANGKMMVADDVVAMARGDIGGFALIGSPMSHKAGQIG
jgi:hypothetical protein